MVEKKFLAEIVIIVVAIAVTLLWVMTNYNSMSSQFFSYLSLALPSLFDVQK